MPPRTDFSRRRRARNLAATLSLAVCFSSACDRGTSTAGGPTESKLSGAASGANVLLITMDTTRADRIGCYGHSAAVTPALDGLARDGVRFEQAFAHAPITLPSHASILTGALPPEHGIRDNGRYALGPELPTLAELFRSNGYRTAAFVSAHVLKARFGLSRGFEAYDDEMVALPDGRTSWDRPGPMTADRALAWLAESPQKPFFCWVHFFDPHAPYAPPPEFAAKTRDPYDGDIAFMDAQIARLLAWLDQNRLREKTLVIAVGDHGESLGEHGFGWHALLVYDSIMRVPLIFSMPGKLPAGKTVSGVAQLVDIFPTLLDLEGWTLRGTHLSGLSLCASMSAGSLAERACYGESDFPYENFGWAKLRCLTESRWKYIRAPKLELYDRTADPGELRNVADAHPEIVRRMEAALSAIEGAIPPRDAAIAHFSSEDRSALQGLGYAGGGAAPTTQDASKLRNPADMVAVEGNYRKGEALLNARQADEAIAMLQPCAAASPESFAIVEMLGKAYAGAGRLDDADRTLLDALALYPGAADTWEFLARVRRGRGRLKGALDACRQALKLDAKLEPAVKLLPELQADWTALQQQVDSARGAADAADAPPAAFARLSALLDAADDVAGAIDALRRGLSRHPTDAGLVNDLAWMRATTRVARLRDANEALALARRAATAAASSPSAVPSAATLDTLAVSLAAAGQFDEAVSTARRAADAADGAGDAALAERIRSRQRLFESRKSFVESP